MWLQYYRELIFVVGAGLYLAGFCADIPIFFIHRGNPDYLEHSLWQAAQYNQYIVLIGDETNTRFQKYAAHFNMKEYFQHAALFEKNYIHFSPTPPSYECFCIQRWFILREFVNKHDIDKFFYCDSDIMLYCDITEILSEYDCDVALPNIQGYSGHNSFWTKNAINCFCDFVARFYENKQNISLFGDRYRRDGQGICDMTLLTEFVRAFGQPEMAELSLDKSLLASEQSIVQSMGNPSLRVERLVKNDTVFDLCNIGHSELGVYQMVNALGSSIKDIEWINNQPYCYHRRLKKFLRFNTLHCQGDNKKIMQQLRRNKL